MLIKIYKQWFLLVERGPFVQKNLLFIDF